MIRCTRKSSALGWFLSWLASSCDIGRREFFGMMRKNGNNEKRLVRNFYRNPYFKRLLSIAISIILASSLTLGMNDNDPKRWAPATAWNEAENTLAGVGACAGLRWEHPEGMPHVSLGLSDAPCGPWSKSVAHIIVPEYRQGKPVEMVYCAYFHPELFRAHGKVMNLTYSLGLKNSAFDANCEMVEIEVSRAEDTINK